MAEVRGITESYLVKAELIETTKKLAPEKLTSVLESLSPTGLDTLAEAYPRHSMEVFLSEPISRGKQVLEQALSIFK